MNMQTLDVSGNENSFVSDLSTVNFEIESRDACSRDLVQTPT
jgi:hypothetical protein